MGIAERKRREKEKRRQAIIEAAEKVFFTKGIEPATMDDVAEEAELSKGTLYLYFKNKDDLLHAIVHRGLHILYTRFEKVAAGPELGIEKLQAIGKAYIGFFQEDRNHFDIMMHKDPNQIELDDIEENPNIACCKETGDRIFSLLVKVVETGIADGSVRPDLEPLKLAITLWGQLSGVFHLAAKKERMLKQILGLEPEDIINYSLELTDHCIKNTAAPNGGSK
jgi:AcrR family transcriptional regulator